MTSKQIERIQNRIAAVKRQLAAEKRKFGGYDDSRGARYLPTRYFIQLGDYAGGLRYIKWFNRNFPDDGGFPEFLFECTIILFKTDRLKKATAMAWETFRSNTYWFDHFFSRVITPVDKWEGSNTSRAEYTECLEYSSRQPELEDFSQWLAAFTSSENFVLCGMKFIEIQKRLKTTSGRDERLDLIRQEGRLGDYFK